MHETDSVKIARLEERVIANHHEVMTTLKPVADLTKKHHDDITVLKRDRYWIFALAAALVTANWKDLLDILGIHKGS